MNTKENKVEKYERILITTDGKEVIVNYELDEDKDDFILEELQEALETNEVFFDDYVTISLGKVIIDQLDFKKIIGIRWS